MSIHLNAISMPRLLVLVLGYNRHLSLSRLLHSLSVLAPPSAPVDLLVSIDGGGDPNCIQRAEQFYWAHGTKRVQVHPRNLGLRTHVETAVDNVADYDAVIVLEDDLSVSPWMFHYCEQAFATYGCDPAIAQISLYAFDINESCSLPFVPIREEGDCWFSQVPSSWGQMWTRDQWIGYRNWQRSGPEGRHLDQLPRSVRRWGEQSWKRSYFEYVVTSGLWIVHPYTSISTNHGDAGTHYPLPTHDFDVPLEIRKRNYRFIPFADTHTRYDAWLEPSPHIVNGTELDPSHLTVDLYGTKALAEMRTPYLLSRKPCVNPIKVYGTHLTPLELNVRLGVPGLTEELIYLGKTTDFQEHPRIKDHFTGRVKRSLQKQLVSEGYLKGQSDLRMETRYRLGNAILFIPSKLASFFSRNTGACRKSHPPA